jgi:hypothetical protein
MAGLSNLRPGDMPRPRRSTEVLALGTIGCAEETIRRNRCFISMSAIVRLVERRGAHECPIAAGTNRDRGAGQDRTHCGVESGLASRGFTPASRAIDPRRGRRRGPSRSLSRPDDVRIAPGGGSSLSKPPQRAPSLGSRTASELEQVVKTLRAKLPCAAMHRQSIGQQLELALRRSLDAPALLLIDLAGERPAVDEAGNRGFPSSMAPPVPTSGSASCPR